MTRLALLFAMMMAGALGACGDKSRPDAPARKGVKKLFEAARSYYMEVALEDEARARFPAPNAGPVPALGTCCKAAGKKCPPRPELWKQQPWLALGFSVDEPHHYSYQYLTSSNGLKFTVRAIGDLDCDGDYATYEMFGEVNKPKR
jgi:hypothetical protein